MPVRQVAKGLNTNYDELVDFLESIEQLIKPLDIYAQIPPTPTVDEIVVKIMAELLSTLALTTKELMHGRRSECILADMLLSTQYNAERFLKKTSKKKDAEAVLRRLDRLSQTEARTTAAETLKVVHSLVQTMSEYTYSSLAGC
jgi:hypothetical protein